MRKFDQYKRLIVFIAAFVILLMHSVVFWFFWHGYYNNVIWQPFFRRGSWVMVALYAMLIFVFTKIYGGFRVGYYKSSEVLISQILGLLFVNGITYLQISLLALGFVNAVPLLIMSAIDVVIIIIWTFISNAIYKRLFPPRKMILLYGDRAPDTLIEKISTRKDKYQICAAMNVNKGYDAIIKVIHDFDAVIVWDIPSSLRNPIVKYCFGHSIRTYIMPKLSDIIIMRASDINLFDTPLLLSRNIGLTFDQKIMKRAMDLVLSILLLILTSPFMLVVSLLIKLYDGGPVFYKQERYTIDGKTFMMYKFRSMIVDAEKDGVARLAEEHDDRITPIGRFLRSIRMDELPQLFNIIAGDMSMVGPRPERPEIAEEYLAEMPEFEYRLKMKAGLTGYAQVYGNYSTTPYDKLKLDICYIESYSIWLDIKLILLTAKIIFQRESTKGIMEGQITAKQINDSIGELTSAIDIDLEEDKK
jgi:exopolysaccharide biosynthesis polyprenyl glycosylphosphotransferase